MNGASGSNALVGVVQFYAEALREAEHRAVQAELLLKSATSAQQSRTEWREFVESVRDVLGDFDNGDCDARSFQIEALTKIWDALKTFDGPPPIV